METIVAFLLGMAVTVVLFHLFYDFTPPTDYS
jgi:hypothetical protein